MSLTFLIEFSIFLSIFYLFFVLFFREDRDFIFSRKYLFGSIIISLVIPILPRFSFFDVIETNLIGIIMTPIEILDSTLPLGIESNTSTGLNIQMILICTYCIICLILFLKLIYGYLEIRQLIKTGTITQNKDFILVANESIHSSFSFFDYVVVPKNILSQEEALELIIQHELKHKKLGHSIEKVIFNIVKIIFWWHPIIHMMQKDLEVIHEYEVDAAMLKDNNIRSYSMFLIGQIETKNNILINTISSHIKKRIVMMYSSKKSMQKITKWSLACLACLSIFLIHACQDEVLKNDNLSTEREYTIIKEDKNDKSGSPSVINVIDTIITFDFDSQTESQRIVTSERTVYKKPEIMPHVAGCELEANEEAIQQCAQKKLLQFIYKNITYPAEAKDNAIEGMSVIQFVVDKNGKIYNEKIVKSIGYGTDRIILDMMNKMKKELGDWVPGELNSKKVDVQYTLPIKFKLEDK